MQKNAFMRRKGVLPQLLAARNRHASPADVDAVRRACNEILDAGPTAYRKQPGGLQPFGHPAFVAAVAAATRSPMDPNTGLAIGRPTATLEKIAHVAVVVSVVHVHI